jgi:hypothetical protein
LTTIKDFFSVTNRNRNHNNKTRLEFLIIEKLQLSQQYLNNDRSMIIEKSREIDGETLRVEMRREHPAPKRRLPTMMDAQHCDVEKYDSKHVTADVRWKQQARHESDR